MWYGPQSFCCYRSSDLLPHSLIVEAPLHPLVIRTGFAFRFCGFPVLREHGGCGFSDLLWHDPIGHRLSEEAMPACDVRFELPAQPVDATQALNLSAGV